MPVETRYFRTDTHTVNGLTTEQLTTTQGTTYGTRFIYGSGSRLYGRLGIRVWVRHADGTEEEITGGTPVASVYVEEGTEGYFSNTWDCPQTSLSSTDAIVVRVYGRLQGDAAWTLMDTWITEQLGAEQLDAATWTVTYHAGCDYNLRFDRTTLTFDFGSSTYNSRIEGFSWTPSAPPPVARRFYGDGLTLIAT